MQRNNECCNSLDHKLPSTWILVVQRHSDRQTDDEGKVTSRKTHIDTKTRMGLARCQVASLLSWEQVSRWQQAKGLTRYLVI